MAAASALREHAKGDKRAVGDCGRDNGARCRIGEPVSLLQQATADSKMSVLGQKRILSVAGRGRCPLLAHAAWAEETRTGSISSEHLETRYHSLEEEYRLLVFRRFGRSA